MFVHVVDGFSVLLQVGCTPCHYDTSYNDPTSLQLSILIYLSGSEAASAGFRMFGGG